MACSSRPGRKAILIRKNRNSSDNNNGVCQWKILRNGVWTCNNLQAYFKARQFIWDNRTVFDKNVTSEEYMPTEIRGEMTEVIDFVTNYLALDRYDTGPRCCFTLKQMTSPDRLIMEFDMSSSTYTGHCMFDDLVLEAIEGTVVDLLHVLNEAGLPRLCFNSSFMHTPELLSVFGNNLTWLKNLEIQMKLSAEVIEMICSIVSTSTSIESLLICDDSVKQISADDFSKLETAFSANKSLQVLNLTGNEAEDGIISRFVQSKGAMLQSLLLSKNQISSQTIMAMNEVLGDKSCQLESIDISNGAQSQSRSEIDLSVLAKNFAQNTTLKHLDLRDNSSTKIAGFDVFSEALTKNSALKELRLEHGRGLFGDDRLPPSCALPEYLGLLFSHLGDWKGLSHLNISNNCISSRGLSLLSTGLRTNSCLEILKARNLQSNDKEAINEWRNIMHALEVNNVLHSLDVEGNTLSLEAIETLARSLTVNITLSNLCLNACGITNKGIEAFASRLPCMRGLRDLNVSTNSFDERGSRALAAAMEYNSSIISLGMFEDLPFCAVIGRVDRTAGIYKNDLPTALLYARLNYFRRHIHHNATGSMRLNLLPLMFQKTVASEDRWIDGEMSQYYLPRWRCDRKADYDECVAHFESPFHCISLLYLLVREEVVPRLGISESENGHR